MALRDLLAHGISAARKRGERLRASLRADERIEERGWDRGWAPRAHVTGLPEEAASTPGAGRDPSTGGPLRDWAPALDALPVWTPDPAALAAYEAGQVWDLSREVAALAEEARARGASILLIAFTLGHCQWSDRAAVALAASRPAWEGVAAVAVARAGDRLRKVYFRDVRLGRGELSLPTFPTTLCLDLQGGGLALRALAFDPLGPSPEHDKVRALLRGESVVPAGSDHFIVTVCTGGMCARVDSAGEWRWGGVLYLADPEPLPQR